MPFRPGSIGLDAPFVTDKNLFGEDDKELDKLVMQSLDVKIFIKRFLDKKSRKASI